MELQVLNKKDLAEIREAKVSDINFILATFLRGLYYGDSWFGQIPKSLFMSTYHKVVNAMLANPNNLVQVACLKSDPDTILAYVIASRDGTTLHWAFCKKAWRGIGLVKDLIPKNVSQVTHLTKVGLSILKRHESLIFNPFAQ